MDNFESALPVIVLSLGAVVILLVIATAYLFIKLRSLSSRQVTVEPKVTAEVAPVVEAPVPQPVEASIPTPEPIVSPVKAEAEAEKTPEPAVEAKQKSDLVEPIPDAIIPILIAAAATAVGRPVRIKDVVMVQSEKPNVWGTQGRIVIQRSHDTASQQW